MSATRLSPTNEPQALLSSVASRREVHAAFQFFHLKEAVFREWHERLVLIPAPPFGEAVRGQELAEIFASLELSDISTDSEGNVKAVLPSRTPNAPCVLVAAHLDTVFPAETPLQLRREGERIAIPGSSDNGAGLAAMLAIAAGLRSAGIVPACDIVFAGTVGEEGEGNLRGMRAIFQNSTQTKLASRIGAVLVLDGAGSSTAVNEALGSRRYLVEINGPGGHSWSDSARPNPIVAMAEAIAIFQQEELPREPATSVNFATIQGGTSVNSIPQTVACKVDIRSLSQQEMVRQEVRLHRAVEDAVLASRGEGRHRLTHKIRQTGERPAGSLPQKSELAEALRVVDRHLQIRTRWRTASTDANIPLARGIPSVTLGGGGTGGNAHTLDEWFDPTDRELALRRILLLLLMTAESVAAEKP